MFPLLFNHLPVLRWRMVSVAFCRLFIIKPSNHGLSSLWLDEADVLRSELIMLADVALIYLLAYVLKKNAYAKREL
jgi:hypothetical protein